MNMSNERNLNKTELFTQTLAAMAIGFMLVAAPFAIFKGIEHSSFNQPVWKDSIHKHR